MQPIPELPTPPRFSPRLETPFTPLHYTAQATTRPMNNSRAYTAPFASILRPQTAATPTPAINRFFQPPYPQHNVRPPTPEQFPRYPQPHVPGQQRQQPNPNPNDDRAAPSPSHHGGSHHTAPPPPPPPPPPSSHGHTGSSHPSNSPAPT